MLTISQHYDACFTFFRPVRPIMTAWFTAYHPMDILLAWVEESPREGVLGGFRRSLILPGALLGDGVDRAVVGAGAALDALVGVDLVVIGPFLDAGHRAVLGAGAAGNALVADLIGHG